MMKFALVLILSLLSVTAVQADQLTREKADSSVKSDATIIQTQPLSVADIPLDYEIMSTNVKGFITSLKDKYPVQLGAFRSKMNAEAFLKEVRARIDKNAIMLQRTDYIRYGYPGHLTLEGTNVLNPETIRSANSGGSLILCEV